MQLTLEKIERFRKSLKKEVSRRKWVYPKQVESYRMTLVEAENEINTMAEILDYFNWLQIHTSPQQQKLF